MKVFPEAGSRPVYFKWWFFVGVILLIGATAYMVRYTQWNADYATDHVDDYARGMAAQLFKYQSDQIEKQYKEDTYGGDTPEATLKLFVEALEKKDFQLAAKYYIPEKQPEALKKISSAPQEALSRLTSAYSEGKSKTVKLGTSGSYEIEIPNGSNPPYYFEFQQNPFSKKWKIEVL